MNSLHRLDPIKYSNSYTHQSKPLTNTPTPLATCTHALGHLLQARSYHAPFVVGPPLAPLPAVEVVCVCVCIN